MSGSVRELAIAYARLGVEHWHQASPRVESRAKRVIGIDIATVEDVAVHAIANPARPNGHRRLTLIPMPCRQRRVDAAFFVPYLIGAVNLERMSFNLVVLMQQAAITFRFEPGSDQYPDSRHGYDHIQLSKTLGPDRVDLTSPVSPLPTTYPAVPSLSEDAVTRFLAMVVSMHGYPEGSLDIIMEAFGGEASKWKTYVDLTKSMFTK